MRQEDVAGKWRTRGFSCGLWTDPPGQVWEGYPMIRMNCLW